MSSNPEITLRLAKRLKEERTAKGLSLDALAKLSGISRSMLSQIERGGSSPTIASLWNLTRALNVDFSGLLDDESNADSPIIEFLRADQTPELRQNEAKCVIKILSPTEEVGNTEIYDIVFDRDACLDSAPHKKGCVEHLTVLDGTITVTSDGQSETLSVGDTLRYAADKNHSIKTSAAARAILVVKNA